MRGYLGRILPVLAALLALSAGAQQESRLVRGQVLDENGKTVENAIVHLKNLNTKETLSVVTDKDGRYRFNEVDKKVDHEIHAEWRAQKSRTRKVSQFDTRDIVTINLPLEPPEDAGEKEKAGDEKKEPR
ncbi:MAG: carboxypeptidase-like regulatory domain-containing protein [Candidatus Acidiferrales bacterium]